MHIFNEITISIKKTYNKQERNKPTNQELRQRVKMVFSEVKFKKYHQNEFGEQ